MHAFAVGQIPLFPHLAAKQKDLPLLALLHQIVQCGMQTPLVERQQCVVQNQRHGVFRRQHHVADGQTHRQIELVGGALT